MKRFVCFVLAVVMLLGTIAAQAEMLLPRKGFAVNGVARSAQFSEDALRRKSDDSIDSIDELVEMILRRLSKVDAAKKWKLFVKRSKILYFIRKHPDLEEYTENDLNKYFWLLRDYFRTMYRILKNAPKNSSSANSAESELEERLERQYLQVLGYVFILTKEKTLTPKQQEGVRELIAGMYETIDLICEEMCADLEEEEKYGPVHPVKRPTKEQCIVECELAKRIFTLVIYCDFVEAGWVPTAEQEAALQKMMNEGWEYFLALLRIKHD